jgi:hypothetical protein
MNAYLSAEGGEISPGDRVEHSDGRMGTVYLASTRAGFHQVRWDDRYYSTVESRHLHLIRKKESK